MEVNMRQLSISLIVGALSLSACDANRADKTVELNPRDQSYQQASTISTEDASAQAEAATMDVNAKAMEDNQTITDRSAGAVAAPKKIAKPESEKSSDQAGASAPATVTRERVIASDEEIRRQDEINDRSFDNYQEESKQAQEVNRWKEYENKTYNELQISDDEEDYPIR
jgi:hypothetical protein